jgi:integrase
MKLNQKAVNSFAPGQRQIIMDDTLKGFGVRITERAVSYWVDFMVGKTRRRVSLGSVTLKTFQVARDEALEVLGGAAKGEDRTVNPRNGMPTFKQVWKELIDEVDRPKLAPATIADYEDRAGRLILPKIGGKLVGDVTPADVDKIVSATPGDRNKAYVVALIKKAINHAKRSRVLPDSHRNPAADIKTKKTKKAGRALETDELAKFGQALAASESDGKVSPWLANLLRLSLICGLRPGEVRTLKWAHVNLPRRKMTVIGKTGSREVDLTEAAMTVLEATPKVQGCEYVFVGRRYGEPIVAVYKQLKLVQERAGIDRFRPYDLRHSAATGALASGADVRAVQALLGHADLQTTAGYLHASDKRRKIAAEGASAFGRGILKNAK